MEVIVKLGGPLFPEREEGIDLWNDRIWYGNLTAEQIGEAFEDIVQQDQMIRRREEQRTMLDEAMRRLIDEGEVPLSDLLTPNPLNNDADYVEYSDDTASIQQYMSEENRRFDEAMRRLVVEGEIPLDQYLESRVRENPSLAERVRPLQDEYNRTWLRMEQERVRQGMVDRERRFEVGPEPYEALPEDISDEDREAIEELRNIARDGSTD